MLFAFKCWIERVPAYNHVHKSTLELTSVNQNWTSLITELEVRHALGGFNNHKCTGPDGLFPNVLKALNSLISSVFARMLNLSFQTAHVPEDWRRTIVTPVAGTCYQKTIGMFFCLEWSFATLIPSIFLHLYKAFIRPHLEYVFSPILSRDCQAIESAQKVVKRLRHVPYETALNRLRLFSLARRRRIRGELICMYKIVHGLLDFPTDTVFCFPHRIGLRCHTFKVPEQRCKNRRHQHAFSVRVVPYWNKLPEENVNASSVETFKLRLDARRQSLFPEVTLRVLFNNYPVA